MTPFDPTGAGRTLDAADMRIDGQAVAADGRFPGLQPVQAATQDGHVTVTLAPGEAAVVTQPYAETSATGGAGGSVPATLALALGAPISFGALMPGVDRTYQASTTATVTSTAGDATLSVFDPGATATGRLVNGAYALADPLQAQADAASFAPLSTAAAPLALLGYAGPISNDAVAIGFRQHIGATEALRSGSYAKTLTFTLSTSTP